MRHIVRMVVIMSLGVAWRHVVNRGATHDGGSLLLHFSSAGGLAHDVA